MRYCALAVLAVLAGMTVSAGEELVIAEGGKSPYVIVYPAEAPPVVETAADDLQHHLAEMTGARLPIQTDEEPLPERAILLGDNRFLDEVGVEPAWDRLGDEGYHIQTAEPHLVIVGGPVRGTAYGVYGLLDDHWGCRWLTAEVSHVPEREQLELPDIDETVVPPLMYRESFWVEASDPMWNLRNRLNGAWITSPREEHGGGFYYDGVHTFYPFVPPGEYFDDHPEYYSLIDGERRWEHAQLCLTNEDVLEIVIEQVRQRFEEVPEADVVSVSQNDWRNPCQCEACQAIAEEEGSEAGPLLHFVNQVADAIREDYPDRYVGTLAYQYTRTPPENIVPRDNVAIRLCSIECCFSHTLEECDAGQNEAFAEDIRGWQELTDNLFIWDYTTNFSHYHQPHPNLRSLRPNIQFFVEHDVQGIFEQGNYNSAGHGEMAPLRNYLLARFLWDPERDYETTLTEFLDLYYGDAAPHVRDYIAFTHDRAEEGNHHFYFNAPPPVDEYFRGDFVEQAHALFDEAEAAVEDAPAYMERVRILRLPVLYVEISQGLQADFEEVDAPRIREAIDAFFALVDEYGIDLLNEGTPMEDFRERCMQSEVYQAEAES
ncbi:MAG: DUF4838 domain-containing protein [Candidatus Hydrogenedentota bacterium]